MNRDDVRNKLFERAEQVLSEKKNGVTQMGTMVQAIDPLIPKDTPAYTRVEYQKLVFEIINEWYRAGLLYFGKPDDPNAGRPWMAFTEFGKECIANGNLLPYDPENYIKQLVSSVPSLDTLTQTYLKESVSAYNSEHLLSASITLGVASENIILQLIESFESSLSGSQATKFGQQIKGRSIYVKHSLFTAELKKHIKKLPSELSMDLDSLLDGVFNFIRITRNKAGHPTGHIPSKKVIGLNLQIFAEYSERIFALIDYFKSNKI